MPIKIRSSKLTHCHVAADGTEVGLELLDQFGATVTVELPLDQAEAVIMTLPHLLSRAVRQRTGSADARYVFDLGEWSIESAAGRNCLIVTLKTADGFEVAFAVPFEAGRSLGWALQQEAREAIEAREAGTGAPAVRPAGLN